MLQIINPTGKEPRYWGEIASGHRAIEIWISEPGYLDRGSGSAMLQSVLQACFDDCDVDSIIIDPLATNRRAICCNGQLDFSVVE